MGLFSYILPGIVSSIWFPLSIGQIVIGTCGSSLPVCVILSDLLFLPHGIALPLQLWLVSSAPSKVRQFSFVYPLQFHKTSSVFYHTPVLEGWLVAPPLLLELFLTLPCSLSKVLVQEEPWRRRTSPRLVQHSTPSALSVVDNNSLFMFLSFVLGGFDLPRDCPGLCSWGERGD
jgi:hypothetical protein